MLAKDNRYAITKQRMLDKLQAFLSIILFWAKPATRTTHKINWPCRLKLNLNKSLLNLVSVDH